MNRNRNNEDNILIAEMKYLSGTFLIFVFNREKIIMKDLSPFIRELLYSHDCVILPGFGGFIANYTPARINRNSHSFNPPVKAISFNSNLDNNDGLLMGKISEQKGIGYGDAKRLAEDYSRKLKSELSTSGRVHLRGIGHFSLNSEGSPQFTPDNDINYLPDSYGLEPFTRHPAGDYDIARVSARRSDRDPVIAARRRRMVWRAAAAVPFIAAMIIVPLKTDLFRSEAGLNPLAKVEFEQIRSSQDELFSAMEATKKEAATGLAETEGNKITEAAGDETTEAAGGSDIAVTETAEAAGDETAEAALADAKSAGETLSAGHTTGEQTGQTQSTANENKAAAVTGTRGGGVYYLVVGSFKDRANALGLYDELNAEGYNAGLTIADNGYFRVSAESFGTRQEAIDERYRLNKSFSQIWICKK